MQISANIIPVNLGNSGDRNESICYFVCDSYNGMAYGCLAQKRPRFRQEMRETQEPLYRLQVLQTRLETFQARQAGMVVCSPLPHKITAR